MIRKIDHIGIAVRDLKEGVRLWTEALGLEVSGTEVVEAERVTVAFLPLGDSRLELLEPTGDDSPVSRFMEKRGEGIHHLTLEVDDIEGVLERLRDAGVTVLGDAPREGVGGSRVAFLHPRSCGGVLVELVQHARRERREWDIVPGRPVLAYLREPQEKVWGVLRRLDPAGVVVEGIDLGSFDDWVAQIERGEESVVGPSVLFVPMTRLEKLLLDRPSGHLPSLAERFFRRTGLEVQDVLEEDPGPTEY